MVDPALIQHLSKTFPMKFEYDKHAEMVALKINIQKTGQHLLFRRKSTQGVLKQTLLVDDTIRSSK